MYITITSGYDRSEYRSALHTLQMRTELFIYDSSLFILMKISFFKGLVLFCVLWSFCFAYSNKIISQKLKPTKVNIISHPNATVHDFYWIGFYRIVVFSKCSPSPIFVGKLLLMWWSSDTDLGLQSIRQVFNRTHVGASCRSVNIIHFGLLEVVLH